MSGTLCRHADQRHVRTFGADKAFTNPWLCAAIVYRLIFAGRIIETGTVFYRLVHARSQRTVTTA